MLKHLHGSHFDLLFCNMVIVLESDINRNVRVGIVYKKY